MSEMSVWGGPLVTCAKPSCLKRVNSELEYVCGGIHGGGSHGCGLLFCGRHLGVHDLPDKRIVICCEDCAAKLRSPS